LVFSLYLMLYPSNVGTSPHPNSKKTDIGTISRIVSIFTHKSERQTAVNILGDGKITEYLITSLETPPRIVIDIFCVSRLLEGGSIAVDTPGLKMVRVGYHTNKIRIVLDIKGSVVPVFTDKAVDNELVISLQSKKSIKEKESQHKANDIETSNVSTSMVKNENINMGDVLEENQKSNKENQTPEKLPSVKSEAIGNQNSIPEQETENVSTKPKCSIEADLVKTSPGEKLIQAVEDDGKEDTSFYLKCLDTYRAKNWASTIENLTQFIEKYHNGRYTEKAYFILAKSYNHLNSESVSVHYEEIKRHYENAISRFPTSEYVPDAMFGIGELYFQIKNYYEALGYYNLVIKEDKGTSLRIRALMQKAKVLLLRHKKENALYVLDELEGIISKYPDLPERIEVKKEKATILYEMNNFYESLKILNELIKEDPENIYKHPEIPLYMGYNYYQLGDNKKARENLFRFFNTCPEREINHLILNQIGDAYRNDGMIGDAVKFYRMVLERYPNSDGAIISKIRLAEQQEERDWIEKTKKEVGSPKKIYENIMNNAVDKKDENDPLIQLSMLKLGIAYQKEKAYQKSLKVLKELFEKYPKTSLKKELTHALMLTIEGILKKEIEDEKYINIINLYFKNRELFLMINAPEIFLSVARAFLYVDLKDMAVEVFKMADILLSDDEKPPDLLFFMGKYLFEKENISDALRSIDFLITDYPSSKFVSEAYRLKGRILLKQEKFMLSADTFTTALNYQHSKCDRAQILIDKAKALTGNNDKENALKVLSEVNGAKKECNFPNYNIDQELGDLYLHLGNPREAMTIYDQIIQNAEGSDKISLKLKLAECYWLLNKKEDSLALYNQISDLNDPFWSNLARERMDEIKFSGDNISERLN